MALYLDFVDLLLEEDAGLRESRRFRNALKSKQFAGADCHESGKSFGSTSAVAAVPPATGWRVIVQALQRICVAD
jgi:hypothetical protein